MITLGDMNIIRTRLTSFILDKMAKFYKMILRKMSIYKYYNAHFYGYVGRCISFLRYLKAFDEYIIKMILTMRSGEHYEKDNKK